jgi:hypothetical protein
MRKPIPRRLMPFAEAASRGFLAVLLACGADSIAAKVLGFRT